MTILMSFVTLTYISGCSVLYRLEDRVARAPHVERDVAVQERDIVDMVRVGVLAFLPAISKRSPR
jgi:hypothetical protein